MKCHKITIRLFYIGCLALFCSCQRVDEAKRILKETDSISKYNIANIDTAALYKAVDILKIPAYALCYRTDLAHGYEYIGQYWWTQGKSKKAVKYFTKAQNTCIGDSVTLVQMAAFTEQVDSVWDSFTPYEREMIWAKEYIKAHTKKPISIGRIVFWIGFGLFEICLLGYGLYVWYRERNTKIWHIIQLLRADGRAREIAHKEDFKHKQQAVENTLLNASNYFDLESGIWKDTNILFQTANQYLCNIVSRLQERYNLKEQDIVICLLTLYHATGKQIAEITHRSPLSSGKLKSITAKHIGTNTAELRAFLVDFMAQ